MTTTTAPAITVTRTKRNHTVAVEGERYYQTFTVGFGYTHAVVYATGGWNPEAGTYDQAGISRHRSEVAAAEAAVEKAHLRPTVVAL